MTAPGSDPHDLARFIAAQEAMIDRVRAELRAGRKSSHWMWFVFPQIVGLGRSETARFYAIRTHEEAAAYDEPESISPVVFSPLGAGWVMVRCRRVR